MTTTSLSTLLLLGTYHMGNPNHDLFNMQADDSRSAQRQREIEECVSLLQAFRPTEVAIEAVPEKEVTINDCYQQYQRGTYALADNEREQLGFRIAAALKHERIYAIDWNEPIGYGIGWLYKYVEEEAPEVYHRLMERGKASIKALANLQKISSIGEVLYWMNQPEQLQANHRSYMHLLQLGEGKFYPGIEWVQGWYGRNMRIFANLLRITEPGDRILVIYGQGHIPLLTQYTRDSGFYKLETVESYLG
ncbi:hypothetical protein KSD_83240 [Ktedonobacter sp. SOSP1-85]|uniref:DUF5694 domain-containing protein n=1 Tax=Ktedonobacter sp. SOSP1-85 TaxID=2778367 RepID=UPI0019157BE7|nr:DUF5694 domain-containing protein [Ktedonobacter sp. SOSP1-85]GHO80553.1 hypothetical protein KSD_83240 [Ktedonobacter sp. SOSP1-85]